jgi:hypothetical protein
MPTTPQGIWYPGSSDNVTPLETTFSTMASSIDNILAGDVQIHRVANTTARNALVSQFPPSNANPLVVWRADATNGRQLEYTKNGTTWHYIPSTEDNSGPTALTIVAGTGQYNPTVRRIGREVALDGAIQQAGGGGRPSIANETWTKVTTLPVGMRPLKYQNYPASLTAVANINAGVRVQTNGDVEVWFGGTTGAYIPLTGVRFWVN